MEGTTLLHTSLGSASVGLLAFVLWAWLRPRGASQQGGSPAAKPHQNPVHTPLRPADASGGDAGAPQHAEAAEALDFSHHDDTARHEALSGASPNVEPSPAAAHDAGHADDADDAEHADAGAPASSAADDDDAEVTMPHALILVTAHGRTDPGLKRKHNEDAMLLLEAHHLFLIADGMGRHAAGEVASQLAVDAVGSAFVTGDYGRFVRDPGLTERGARLKRAIEVANQRVFEEAHNIDAYAGMGTTLVSVYFSLNRKRVYVAHVGDSRCYRFRANTLEQLTQDHTLEAAGIKGPTGGFLSRAVGIEENVEIDVRSENIEPNDTFLLCSDGLSRMANDREIQEIIAAESNLQVAVQRLIDLANARGGKDNVTVILVRAEEPSWKAND